MCSYDVEKHWWSVSRWLCDCCTDELAADLSTAATIGSATSILGVLFRVGSIPGAVFGGAVSLFVSRLNANNHGHGVYAELTYVYVFDITPQ